MEKNEFRDFGEFSGSFLSIPDASFGRSSVPDIRAGPTGGEAEREDMGSGGSLSSVLSPRRMKFVMPRPVIQGPKLDDGGDGGGMGKFNHNGGGGGDGDDDDDDFFAEDDGEGEGEGSGDGFLRGLIPESFDKLALACVFAEWMRTMADLPLILRRSVEMGLFSSAQLVRFFSMDVRPGVARTVSRSLPPTWARDFVGRLMADPAFVQKMVVESTFAAALSLWYESRARGEKFMQELDLALINSLGMAVATGATTWLVAPTRSYGAVHKFPWQQALEGLPNNVFDASGPLRHYTVQTRVGGFLSKMAELSAVGALTGSATSLMAQGAVALRQRSDPTFQPSVAIPSVGQSSAGLAAYFAINANTRYQLIGGMDRFLMERCKSITSYLGISAATRALSQGVGELSRPWWQGLPEPQPPQPKTVRRRVARKVSKRVPRSSLTPVVAVEAPMLEQAGPLAVPMMDTVSAAVTPVVAELVSSSPASAASAFPEAVSRDAPAMAASSAPAPATPAPKESAPEPSVSVDPMMAMMMAQQQQAMAAARQQQSQQEETKGRRVMRGGGPRDRRSSL